MPALFWHCFAPSSLKKRRVGGTRTALVLLQPPHPHPGPPSACVQHQGSSAAPPQPLLRCAPEGLPPLCEGRV
jgi:hypothetical protein